MTREEKINTLKAIIQECEEYQWQRKETLFEIIKDLEQRPRKGKWINTEFMKLKECSICHARWGIYSVEEFDFCPSCGAKMAEKR